MASEIRSRFVSVNGIRTHYSQAGETGPALIAMHGGGAGSSGVAGMGALMSLLGDSARVIALDSIGGFGETDPRAPMTYGLQSRVEHLLAFADTLCLDRFHLIGNSQGAWCIAKYAMMRPDRVDRLVLMATATIAMAMGIRRPPSQGMKLMEAYDWTPNGMRTLLEGIVHDKSKITDALVDRRQAVALRPGARETFEAGIEANQRLQRDPLFHPMFDMRASLPEITKLIPTIMIWGEEDVFAVPDLGRELEALLPDVKFHWVPKAGHQVQTDRPEIVAELVRHHLGLR